ncbi:VOC family protein [Chloroflexota bacterium]
MGQTEKGVPFSSIDQIGIIVRDLDRAVKYYESLGIGPFKPLEHITPTERIVRGKIVTDVKNKMMFARAGPVQLELIQPIEGDSIQKEFLEMMGEGVNHFGFFVDDIEKETANLVKKGFKVVESVKFKEGGGVAHFDTDEVGGILFELIQTSPK